MKRPVVVGPTYSNKRMFEAESEPGVRLWQRRIAPGVRVLVRLDEHTGASSWRVEKLGLLDSWHGVKGGPQKAANEAEAAVERLMAEVRAA